MKKIQQLTETEELNSKSKDLRLNISYDIFDWTDEDTKGITEYKIDIFQNDVLAGLMTARKFDLEVIDYILDALDLERETAPFMELFKNNAIKEKVLKAAQGIKGFREDLLILDRLEILPQFRGNRLAESIFELIDNSIGFYCLTLMIAFPLQLENEGQAINHFGDDWSHKMNLTGLSQDEKKSIKSLTNYYESCGFRVIPKCSRNFMVRLKEQY